VVNKTHQVLDAKILNISTSGVYIKCIGDYNLKDKLVVVTFSIEKDGINSLASFEGTVVREEEEGMALEITERDFDLFSKFIDIILMANEDGPKIKSSIYNSNDFVKQWKGGFVNGSAGY
jgi:hypothetical protein